MKNFDVIVLGLGAMGSAACYHLAKRGAKVLGIDQFAPAHRWGSSHGKRRLIRRAYFEHPDYVPLLNRSYELWRELESASGKTVLHETGLLLMGPDREGGILAGAQASASLHEIPIEKLSREDLANRYPQFQPPDDFYGLFEPGAGYVEAENGVETQLKMAAGAGAELHFNERVSRWSAQQKTVVVRTDRETYGASQLILAAGAWSESLLHDLGLPLVVRRVPQFWVDSPSKFALRAGCPCFGMEMPYGFIYGFPSIDDEALKVAEHTPREVIENPSAVDRDIHPEDFSNIRSLLSQCMAGVATQPSASSVCMYTMTPDEHFVIDFHPKYPNVVIAAGFSGHGFKFAPVVGLIASELTLDGKTALPADFLRMGSFRAWPQKIDPAKAGKTPENTAVPNSEPV